MAILATASDQAFLQRFFIDFVNVVRGMTGQDTLDRAQMKQFLATKRDVSVDEVFWKVWDAVYERFVDEDMWFMNLFYDESGQLFAILNGTGKLYRVNVSVAADEVSLGDPVQVKLDYPEVEQQVKPSRAVHVVRQADGSVRWLIYASAAILNRSSELDSRALYDSMIKHWQDTGEAPYLTIAHAGEEYRLGAADMLLRDGYVYLNSGTFDDTDEARAVIEALESDPEWWGASIGFYADEPAEQMRVGDLTIPVYNKGRQIEVSLLKETSAASFLTGVAVTSNQGETRMSKVLEEALAKVYGEEKAKEMAAEADTRNRAIEEANVIRRDGLLDAPAATTEAVAAPVEEPVVAADAAPQEVPDDTVKVDPIDERIKALEEAVAARESKLLGAIEALTAQIADMQASVASGMRSLSENAEVRIGKVEQAILDRSRDIKLDVPRAGKLIVPAANSTPPVRPSERADRQVDPAGKGINLEPPKDRLNRLANLPAVQATQPLPRAN